MKTVEMVKFNKVYYVMIRYAGMTQARECYKKKGDADRRVKELKKEGYADA